MLKCSVEGCSKPTKARSFCGNHYALWRRNGVPAVVSPRPNRPEICQADGCNERHSSKGYCSKHYARWVKYGATELPEKKQWRCAVEGCNETKHKAKGFCRLHYERYVENRKLDAPKRELRRGEPCTVDGCNGKRTGAGYCSKHYQRWKAHGDPLYTKNKRRQNGDGKLWHKAPQGYIVRYEPDNLNAGPNGQVYQHRHVMSQVIGRPLARTENVHHINGDRSDNRPENLQLWSKAQPPGQRLQDKAVWCAEFLRDHFADIEALDTDAARRLRVIINRAFA